VIRDTDGAMRWLMGGVCLGAGPSYLLTQAGRDERDGTGGRG
jgi:hypothetical protein